jgi:hypothetical protein
MRVSQKVCRNGRPAKNAKRAVVTAGYVKHEFAVAESEEKIRETNESFPLGNFDPTGRKRRKRHIAVV